MQRFIAAGFGAGLIPQRLYGSHNGAGSFGAAVGVLFGLILLPAPWIIHLIAAGGAVALSLWAAEPFVREAEDPGWVAIDEVAGTMVAMIGLSGIPWVVAIVVSRVLDILKLGPGIRRAETLYGALGVTLDDVLAGFYGLAVGIVLALII